MCNPIVLMLTWLKSPFSHGFPPGVQLWAHLCCHCLWGKLQLRVQVWPWKVAFPLPEVPGLRSLQRRPERGSLLQVIFLEITTLTLTLTLYLFRCGGEFDQICEFAWFKSISFLLIWILNRHWMWEALLPWDDWLLLWQLQQRQEAEAKRASSRGKFQMGHGRSLWWRARKKKGETDLEVCKCWGGDLGQIGAKEEAWEAGSKKSSNVW